MLLSSILRDTRIALNMNHACEPLIAEGDIDTLTLDELIANRLEPVARQVIEEAPLTDLGEGAPFGGCIRWEPTPDSGAGSLLLPPDFLRLVIFRLSGWGREATLLDARSPLTRWGQRPGGRVRGYPHQPLAYVAPSTFGNRLHFFAPAVLSPRRAGIPGHIAEARYIPLPRLRTLPTATPGGAPSAHRDLPFPSRLYPVLIQTLASNVSALCYPQ